MTSTPALLDTNAHARVSEMLARGDRQDYAGFLAQEIRRGNLTADQALLYPLGERGAYWLDHTSRTFPAMGSQDRDARLTAWVEAAMAAGGDLDRAMKPHPTRGSNQTLAPFVVARSALTMMKLECLATLECLRRAGLEKHLMLGQTAGPTTLLEVAIFTGQGAAAKYFTHTGIKRHADLLWRRLWDSHCLGQAKLMSTLLAAHSTAPQDFLDGFPTAEVNRQNIGGALGLARRARQWGLPMPATLQGRTALGRALEGFRSPAGNQVVQWLLDEGANPQEITRARLNGEDWEGNALELGLALWLGTSKDSQLRPAYKASVEAMVGRCPVDATEAIFTPDRLEDMESTLRKTRNASFGKQRITVEEEIAWLRRITLMGVGNGARNDASARKLRM